MCQNLAILLLFDLDFTLIDNTIGISNSFNYALSKYGLPVIEMIKIKELIGTPLDQMFLRFTDSNINDLCKAFREYYGVKGIHEVILIEGTRQKLIELKREGFKLGVITSKKHEMAIKLLHNLDLINFFNIVQGETKDIKSKSNPLLKEILLNEYPNHKFIVIGDHLNDRKLAEMLNCPFIGVLTGYHLETQLNNNSRIKTIVLKSIKEISPIILKNLFV